ncbi:MAG: tyrosine--tRNA ligase, partial [Candidatus Aminicenantes bacterium]|nr:tyrosine--tRNA ligase [Candidatus Aminicenantes bacterium]
INRSRLEQGINPAELFAELGLTGSRGEAKRLIKQGGLYINDQRIDSLERWVNENDLTPEGILLRSGRKKYHRVLAK